MKKSLFKSLLVIASGIFVCTSNAVVYEASVWQKTLADGTMGSIAMFDDMHIDYICGVLGRRQQSMILQQAALHNAHVIAEDHGTYDGRNEVIKNAVDMDSAPSPIIDFSHTKITDSNKQSYFASIPMPSHLERREYVRDYNQELQQ